tara:strand:- start:1821 stop:3167 length:1347 start_codon:yes stop_codon:yes gene_type:complete
LTKSKNEKLFIENLNENFSKKDKTFLHFDNHKFIELASSLAYYASLFTSLKRFLEYVSLVSKYLINQEFSLVIPLDEKGEIWLDHIFLSGDSKYKDCILEVKNFIVESDLSNNFRIKDVVVLEEFLKQSYPFNEINIFKIKSRGKCRGFFYIFNNKLLKTNSSLEERKVSFLLDILAIAFENHSLNAENKRHENTDREISSGAEIQSRLLPDFCPKIFGVDLSAHCRPALQLGGDYYDFMSMKPNLDIKRRQKGRWALVIGDVMGKGVPAGLLMTMLRGMLRAEVLTGLPPDRILHDLNQLAIYDLDQSHRFVTLFYSDYDPRAQKLRYANAAHNPPFLWKSKEQKIVKLDAEGFLIGLQKDAEYYCGEVQLNNLDVILYYTDGITDATNKLGERFGEKNLQSTFSKLCKKNLKSQEILNQIFKKLDDFTGKKKQLDDDASVVIFKLE